MTGRPGQTITFNDVGKVSKVVSGSVTQDAVYDADGNLLLRKNTTEGASLFVGDTVLSQAPGSSVVSGFRTYSGAEGKPVAQRSAKSGTAGTIMTWLFSNLEGTVDVQTVANTAVTSRVFRDPYGAPIGSSGVWGSGTGYMNKQVTASTGLTTVGARTYDPVLGKFLSVDPVIDTNLPQQNTGYTYSGNNPTTYMDPSGLRLDEGCGWGRSCKAKVNLWSGVGNTNAATSNSWQGLPQKGASNGSVNRNKLFSHCGGDRVCASGHQNRTKAEVRNLISDGYRPFGIGNRKVYLDSAKTYTWTVAARPSTDIRSITLRYDEQYKWIMSIDSQPVTLGLRGDSAIEDGWGVVTSTIGESADQESLKRQYNCHSAGALPEAIVGNGTWDLESSRPSNPDWMVEVPGRVWSSKSAAAACSW